MVTMSEEFVVEKPKEYFSSTSPVSSKIIKGDCLIIQKVLFYFQT